MRNRVYTEPASSERKYRRLAALGRELGVPAPQVFIEFEVTMPDGRVVHHHKQRAHSWVRNAYNMLYSQMAEVNCPDNTYAAGKLSCKMYDGTVTYGAKGFGMLNNSDLSALGDGYRANGSVASSGPTVGYSTQVESFEDYVLINPILEGTTNDHHHLNFIASQAYVNSYDAPSKTWSAVFTRYMNNNSGDTCTVNEAALYLQGYTPYGSGTYCVSRDHLGSPVVIPNTGQLKVTYTISMVYPA